MVRLRNIQTGAVINVADEKAARLSPREWAPADQPAITAKTPPVKKAVAKKAASKSSR